MAKGLFVNVPKGSRIAMVATLILWGHALAALLFGALALAEWRRPPEADHPRAAWVAASLLTALWALSVAGVGAADSGTQVARSACSIGWLCVVMLTLRDAARIRTIMALAAVVGAVFVIEAAVAAAQAAALPDPASRIVASTRALLTGMATVGALLLLSHGAQSAQAERSGGIRLTALALALFWAADLAQAMVAALAPDLSDGAAAMRGLVLLLVALALAAAGTDRGVGMLAVSRTVVLRLLILAALAAYAALTALVANGVAVLVGGEARAAQTAVIFAATAALLALVSTPWLRAWTRVTVSKHLFGHRYDYRVEWQRFTGTVGLAGADAAPLATRIVKAVADLTDSPAGLLLVPDGEALVPAADWRWSGAEGRRVPPPLARHLAATGRIVALDELRATEADAAVPEAEMLPDWLVADTAAWALVPLPHGGELIGAIVLARPPVDRALDWEDFDLLRVVGRQAASYLAEDRSHAALAEAQRFDEFNRRFAFLIHDIKNVASQLSLVARNAERHADNPDFRADMVTTLRETAERMTVLLTRLSGHDGGRAEALRPVDLARLAADLAAARRAQHPVVAEARGADGAVPLALAHPVRLEQALGHLIQNAIDASAADSPVTLAMRMEGADSVAIEVRDRGRGMTAAFIRDELFRPFASSKPHGFGLGAFEARQLVEAMGGRLTVESRPAPDPDSGTLFRITLPAAPAMEIAA